MRAVARHKEKRSSLSTNSHQRDEKTADAIREVKYELRPQMQANIKERRQMGQEIWFTDRSGQEGR